MMAAGGIWPYVFVTIAGILATDFWRWLGVLTAARLDENSEILRWVRAVSTALVAGLVARIVIFPIGAMALTPLSGRVGAVVVGLIVYVALRKNVFLGILAAEAVLIGATIWATGGL